MLELNIDKNATFMLKVKDFCSLSVFFQTKTLTFFTIGKSTLHIKVHTGWKNPGNLILRGFNSFSLDCTKTSQFTPFKGSIAIWASQDKHEVDRVNNFALRYCRILQFIKYPKIYLGPLMGQAFYIYIWL